MASSCKLSTSASTRSNSHIWLTGNTEDKILSSKLPSNRQVLSVFFHYHKVLNQQIHESAKLAMLDVMTFWN